VLGHPCLLSAAGRHLARRLASPIRGTPASRRSHRGDFGRRGRASPHRHCGRIGHSELPRPGRSARRGAPASRGDGCESPPQDATPRSVLRIVSRARPLMSKAENLCSNVANRSQVLNTRCAGASMSGPTQQARVRPKWRKSQYKFSPQPRAIALGRSFGESSTLINDHFTPAAR
jgi:hypothetical protein